jgi:response regulator of citrate/malate metabolism
MMTSISSKKDLTILIIEDDTSFRELLVLRLTSFFPRSSFHCYGTVRTGKEALRDPLLQPDLLILDHNLPDGSGVSLLNEGLRRNDTPVLIISSDNAPEIPGASVEAGATFFLSKGQITDALLRPLLEGMLEQAGLQRKLKQALIDDTVVKTVKTLLATLRHEINNPLGAVIGAAHLITHSPGASDEQKHAAKLVHESGMRIKEVLDKLMKATSHESIEQAATEVFKIPGD